MQLTLAAHSDQQFMSHCVSCAGVDVVLRIAFKDGLSHVGARVNS